jgi:hypothetical protein
MVLFKFGFELLDIIGGKIMVELNVGLVRAELLVRIKFDALTASFSRFFNGFEACETIEGVCLAANGEATDFATIGEAIFAATCECGDNANHQNAKKSHAGHYWIAPSGGNDFCHAFCNSI